MSSNSNRTGALILITAGVGAALLLVVAARNGRDRPVNVTTAHAVRQNLASTISTNGKVEPVEPHVLQSQLTTFIDTVKVKEGQTVTKTQILATLDARDLRTDLIHAREQLAAAEDDRRVAAGGGSRDEIAQLDADLSKINAEIDRLRSERDSLERLYAKQNATRQEVDQNRDALNKALADKRLIEEKKAALLDRSKLQAEHAALRAEEARSSILSLGEKLNAAQVQAPVGGTVYSLPAKAGMFVHTGDTLAELADLKRIRVRVFVDEPDLGSLKEGQAVEITWDAMPNRTWSGQVDQLPKTIVARGSRNVGEVLCSAANEDGVLLPNTNVNARIRTSQRENSLTLARAAVRSEGNNRYVFVIDGGRLRKQEVRIGISNATDFEILGGITENDVIALPGSLELQEGMAVSTAVPK